MDLIANLLICGEHPHDKNLCDIRSQNPPKPPKTAYRTLDANDSHAISRRIANDSRRYLQMTAKFKRSARVTFFLTEQQMALLQEIAFDRSMTVAEVVRDALEPHLEEKSVENLRRLEKDQARQAKEAAKVPEYRGVKNMTGEKWNRFMKAWSEYVVFLQPQRDALIPHYGAKGVQIMENFYHQCVADPNMVMAWEEYIDDDNKSGPIYHRNHRY